MVVCEEYREFILERRDPVYLSYIEVFDKLSLLESIYIRSFVRGDIQLALVILDDMLSDYENSWIHEYTKIQIMSLKRVILQEENFPRGYYYKIRMRALEYNTSDEYNKAMYMLLDSLLEEIEINTGHKLSKRLIR